MAFIGPSKLAVCQGSSIAFMKIIFFPGMSVPPYLLFVPATSSLGRADPKTLLQKSTQLATASLGDLNGLVGDGV